MSETEEHRIDREIHASISGSDPFSAAVRATRMPMLITDPRQLDNPIVFVNDAFARLTGYSREETLGRNCRFLQGPATNTDDVGKIRTAIDQRVPIEIELLNYRKDGTTFWNRLLISPVFDEGQLTYFFASQFDVTPERDRINTLSMDRDALESENQRRVLDLAASEERLRFTLQAGGLGTWTLDIPHQRLVASSICKSNFGRGPTDSFTYQDLQNSIHPSDLARWRQTLDECLAGNGDFNIEYRAITPAGEIRWIEIRAQTKYDAHGHPISMTGVSMDITERKEGEAHRQLLVQELGHRIKNILATVQSIVSQSVRGSDASDDLATVINQRIDALGGAHDILVGRGLDRAKLLETVARALKPFRGDGGRINILGRDDIELSSRSNTALTMALHELATNAVKYGALSNDTGHLEVDWSLTRDEFVLTWQEFGGPSVSAPTRTGFGSRMIERALTSTLGGPAKIDYLPSGVRFELRTDRSRLGDGLDTASSPRSG